MHYIWNIEPNGILKTTIQYSNYRLNLVKLNLYCFQLHINDVWRSNKGKGNMNYNTYLYQTTNDTKREYFIIKQINNKNTSHKLSITLISKINICIS